jgi:hypothetical protein
MPIRPWMSWRLRATLQSPNSSRRHCLSAASIIKHTKTRRNKFIIDVFMFKKDHKMFIICLIKFRRDRCICSLSCKYLFGHQWVKLATLYFSFIWQLKWIWKIYKIYFYLKVRRGRLLSSGWGRWLQTTCPLPLWVRMHPLTLYSFMCRSYPASLW